MKRPEQALQRAVAAYLFQAIPDAIWFHVPNGGRRSRIEGGILKAMGVRAGVPDLVFVRPCGRAAFIELKASEKGRLSPDQKAFQGLCEDCLVQHAVCTTLAEVEEVLIGWGFELRARVAA